MPGDARCLPTNRYPHTVIIRRRPGEAGASAGSTRRCPGRLLGDPQPQSDPNRHGNPLATRYAGVWECDARQGGATGPMAPARSWRVAQAGGEARDQTAPSPAVTQVTHPLRATARTGVTGLGTWASTGTIVPTRPWRVASPGVLATGLLTTVWLPRRRRLPTCYDLVRVGGPGPRRGQLSR